MWGDNLEEFGGIPHQKSHGQAFLSLITNRFRGGIYLLDEPESALSPQNQLAIMAKMHELTQNGSQFIIATHSPILTSIPNSTIYNFDDTGIYKITREETESYIITKMMLDDSERILRQLL